MWNDNVLRETLEAASKNIPNAAPIQAEDRRYWAACMTKMESKPPA